MDARGAVRPDTRCRRLRGGAGRRAGAQRRDQDLPVAWRRRVYLVDAHFPDTDRVLLEKHLQLELSAEEKTLLAETFALLTENNLQQPQVVMHRDFHSRNLMVSEDDSLAVIDFQDMVLGPLTYDAVSLHHGSQHHIPEIDHRQRDHLPTPSDSG